MKKYVTLKLILILLFLIPKTIYAIDPPVVTVTGNQNYCPGETSKNIVETVKITPDPLDLTTTNNPIFIQISSGYDSGNDILNYVGTNPAISATWFPLEGKLKLFSTSGGQVPYADYETAIKNVQYKNSSTTALTGARTFSFVFGVGFRELSYLPSNGHYYEYISQLNVTWQQAAADAQLKTYNGLKGYLITITSADEQQLAATQASGTGWIGATDVDEEGVWRWVTGPEGLVKDPVTGILGTVFFKGYGGEGYGFPTGSFHYWNTKHDEPNGAGDGEDYAHIVSPDLPNSVPGSWNDMGPAGNNSGPYQAKGYIIEYGDKIIDSPGASTTITIPGDVTYLVPNKAICPSETYTPKASVTDLNDKTTQIYWYKDLTGGTPLGTSPTFTTPQLDKTTTYYSDNGCTPTPRKAIKITVTTVPKPTVTSPVVYDKNDAANSFPTAPDTGYALKWYNAAGDLIVSPPNPIPSTATIGTTSYFVSQIKTTSPNCEGDRSEIKVIVNGVPGPPSEPATTPKEYCQNDTPTDLSSSATKTGSCNCTLRWYPDNNPSSTFSTTAPTPDTKIASTTPITYYVSQFDNDSNKESLTRAEIKVTINAKPVLKITNPQPVCSPATVDLTATDVTKGSTLENGSLSYWTDSAATNVFSTPNAVTASGIYYIKVLTAKGCFDIQPVTVTINAKPVLKITVPSTVCSPLTIDLTATNVTNGSTLEGGALSYWNDPGAANSEMTTPNTVTNSGTYYIKVLTTSGCFDIQQVAVSINPKPVLKITAPQAVCSPLTIDLTATNVTNGSTLEGGTLSYWTNSDATNILSTPNAVSTSGTYYIKALTASGCFDIQPIIVTIGQKPVLMISNPTAVCSPTSVDLKAAAITAGSNLQGGVLSYWTDPEATTSEIPNPNAVTSTGIYYIKVLVAGGCMEIQPVNVTVYPKPILLITSPSAVCSPLTVDLTSATVTSGSTLQSGILSYWKDSDATNKLLTPNAVSTSGTYYIKVLTTDGCMDVQPVNVVVNPKPVIKITNPATVCSPSQVDLTADTVTVGSTTQGGVFSYWLDSGASTALPDPNAVTVSGIYHIKVLTSGGCTDIKQVTVTINPLPTANPVIIPPHCDDDTDGKFTFDTKDLESTLLGTQSLTNVTVTYFDQAKKPLPSLFPATFTTATQTITAVVTNSFKCSAQTTIQFNVDIRPKAYDIDPELAIRCDDEKNPLLQDGKFAFNTSKFEATILGGQTGMIVKYFDQDNNPLSSPLPNPFKTATQTVKVRVENPNNAICSSETTINFVVNPLPKIDMNLNGNADELYCSNVTNFSATLDAGIQSGTPANTYTYIWKKDGKVQTPISSSIIATTAGIYAVQVANASGASCPVTRIITIKTSNSPEIKFIEIKDLTDVNTVIVNVKEPGDYLYSLDGSDGFWQDSNVFENVPPGIHKVYVKNGCGEDNETINIIGAPKFFTPNNDGYNDYWNIKGLDASNSNSIISIYDRYGKLIKQWFPYSDEGWDGTYNRALLPSEDYWYSLKLENGREAKGHFSLNR